MNMQDLEIFRCPHCAPAGRGALQAVTATWLGCGDCGRHYPIVKDIPVLIPEEGDKWAGVAAADLPNIDYYDRFVSG